MAFRTKLLRSLRAVGLTILAVLLVLVCLIQFQQRLLRHHAEQLLADFQSIRLHQSTWADAQRLMDRWGAWGHYDGQCNSSDCSYMITLDDCLTHLSSHLHSDRVWRLLAAVNRGYEMMGGKTIFFRVGFRVQDGSIWRSGVGLRLSVPPHSQAGYENGYDLLLTAKASDVLHESPSDTRKNWAGSWILGPDDQLAQHPNYKAGRPGGCEGCLSAEVTFTQAISSTELRWITAYDFSCFTRFHPCLNLPDLLPAARDWHFYRGTEPAYQEPPILASGPCDIPLFARARDATTVLVGEVLSNKELKGTSDEPTREFERATVRLVQTLKRATPTTIRGEVDVIPWAGDANFQSKAPEHLEAGKRYILFSPYDALTEQGLGLDYCGTSEDSPETQEQLRQGFEQNDALRPTGEPISLLW